MIKKITLVLLICCMIVSCGKKGCPKNDETEKCNELFNKA